ncbi:hypothetical protein ACIRL2_32505 [Embleya sp. NPDC127516]|uniref:hypothetical protein n=1 Tax=Embleya sp. NPDC127516 TaxID=3363990 RepID=UPI0038195202
MSEQAGPSRPEPSAIGNLWTAVGQAPPAAPGRSVPAWALGYGPLEMTAAPQPAPGPLAVVGRGFNRPVQPLEPPGTYREKLIQDGFAVPSRAVEGGRDANATRAAAVAIGMTPAGT